MNIIDAIKSGRRFRRPCHKTPPNGKWGYDEYRDLYDYNCDVSCLEEDILADDWEIEEESIQITETQLLRYLSRFPELMEHESFDRRYAFQNLKETK